MKFLAAATPVSSTSFNLKIIFLSSKEESTKGVVAKDFPTFAHTVLSV